MGCVGNTGEIPIAECLQAAMEPDAQRNAGQAMDVSGKNPQPAEIKFHGKLPAHGIYQRHLYRMKQPNGTAASKSVLRYTKRRAITGPPKYLNFIPHIALFLNIR